MKNFYFLFVFLLSFQLTASAMMRSPVFDKIRTDDERMLKIHRKEKWTIQGLPIEKSSTPFPPFNIEPMDPEQNNKINLVRTMQRKINEKICTVVPKVYQKINSNWAYVPSQEEMNTDSPFWEASWKNGEIVFSGQKQKTLIPTLTLKTSPANIVEALEDLITRPASLECTIALTTAKIFCMKEILGEFGQNIFKEYATLLYQLLEETEGWTTDQFFHELPEQFLSTLTGKPMPGSICYLTNIPAYRYFKPTGNGAGSNVFCVKDNQYLGFSNIYKNGPRKIDVIEEQDIALFCSEKDVEKNLEMHKIMCQKITENIGYFKKLCHEEQEKNYNFHIIFDAEKFMEFQSENKVYL